MQHNGISYWKSALCTVLLALLVTSFVNAQPAAAQTGEDEISDQDKAIHYSLYYENYKNENYADALPDLRWILLKAPAYPRNKDTNFERATEIYEALAEQAESSEETRAWLDSALVIFDTAVPRLNDLGAEVDEFVWLRDKGRFIQTHKDELSDLQDQAIDAYLAMYELEPERVNPYYLSVILNDHLSNQEYGTALDFMGELSETRGDEPEVAQVIEDAKSRIDPEDLIDFLEDQVEADPDNIELRLQYLEAANELGLEDEALETVNELLTLAEEQPDEFSEDLLIDLYRQALDAHVKAGNVSESRLAFDKLEELGAEIKAEDYYNMGVIEQQATNYGSAKRYYRQALNLDPDFRQARVAIPNLYVTAASTCNASADRETRAVYWLIADAYRAAGMASQAGQFEQYGPSEEDIFYMDKWTKGQSTSVSFTCQGLTISGSTIVR
jgi:tetratricopeptide (TPR) repeat protein